MPASKDEVVQTIRRSQEEIEKVALTLPEAAWSRGVYESGWNAKQLLCHLAENSGVAGFLIGLAKASVSARASGSGASGGGNIDIDAWNAQRVALLQDKPISDVLMELRANSERNVAAVEAAPADLLAQNVKAPWDAEGPLADVIVQSIREHGGVHLKDLRSAAP